MAPATPIKTNGFVKILSIVTPLFYSFEEIVKPIALESESP